MTPITTVADLIARLGGVPLPRVRFDPYPGTAIENDILEAERDDCLCELVDGVLVEKAVGFRESILGAYICAELNAFVRPRNLGLVSGASGPICLSAGVVRMPGAAFASWDRVPNRCVPKEPIPEMAPDLVVEVLREGNTPGEMARKRHDYFTAGVRLVWLADPRAWTVDVYTRENQFTRLMDADVLDGGDALPGFRLPVRDWFGEMDRQR